MNPAHAPGSRLEFDLLVALDALLDHGSVTRAAQRLGLTQSAMSHRLRRLRVLLGDPVLVAGRSGLVATPRAAQLGLAVRKGLEDLRAALATLDRFDPSTSTRTFTVVSTDFAEFDILPRVLEEISRTAPNVTINLREPFAGVALALERGEADLVVGAPLTGSAALLQRKVGEDRFVCAVRRDHPGVGARLDLDTYVRLRHLVINPTSSPSASMLEDALAKLGRARTVAMRIPHFLGAPYIVARSNLLVTSSMALLKHAATLLPLRLFGPPLALPVVRTIMTWHARMNEDPAHAWLRDVTQRCTTAVLTATPRAPAAGEPLDGRRTAKRGGPSRGAGRASR